jgi:hypothetical protein
MSTYGGIVKELPIVPTPIAAASTLIRGNLVEIVSNLAVVWAGTNPVFGVCIGDADNDLNFVDVYVGKGASFQVLCDTGVVPAIGALLGYSSANGVKTSGIVAATAVCKAVRTGINGMCEVVWYGGVLT